MYLIKIIIINILILFSFLFILIISPPTIFFLKSHLGFTSKIINEKILLKNHTKEINSLNTKYKDFVVWRRTDTNLSTINITNGLRYTTSPDEVSRNDEFWFFGGSTTWGTGVNDANTYPSKFALLNKVKAVNFGESSYITRQSLAMLINQYSVSDIQTKRTIIFYDGVNDVQIRCGENHNGSGSAREKQIQNILDSSNKWKFSRTFRQFFEFVKLILLKIPIPIETKSERFICDTDSERSEYVAKTLVSYWLQAKAITESNGDEFVAILQPVAFIGKSNVNYLNFGSIHQADQFKTVYPLIKKYANASDLNFLDFTDIYDECNNCFIDFSHATSNAHDILVRRLSSKLLN